MSIRVYNDGKRLTPNQFAKWLIFDKTEIAFYFDADEHGRMTENERDKVVACLEHQQDRIRAFLNIDKLNI